MIFLKKVYVLKNNNNKGENYIYIYIYILNIILNYLKKWKKKKSNLYLF